MFVDELADDDDEIDEAGEVYMEKLGKVSLCHHSDLPPLSYSVILLDFEIRSNFKFESHT